MATHVIHADQLERELAELLEVEKFPPPKSFREKALVKDDSLYEEAERDFQAFWAKQATELVDWFTEPQQALNDSNPPFYKWFEDGKLNVSYNCLDRHVEAGNGDKVAFHWRGEEGEEREITYAELLGEVQKFANALKDRGHRQGRHRRDLPADDPRGRRGDAGLRPHRRAAQRRLRRLLARRGEGAHGVCEREGAGHRRRRAPQGQDRADQVGRRREDRRRLLDRDDLRRQGDRRRLRDAGGARRLVPRGAPGGGP